MTPSTSPTPKPLRHFLVSSMGLPAMVSHPGCVASTSWSRRLKSTSRRFASSIGSVRSLLSEAPNMVVRYIVGGVISPLLANLLLRYVLDEWFEKEVARA